MKVTGSRPTETESEFKASLCRLMRHYLKIKNKEVKGFPYSLTYICILAYTHTYM